MKSSIIMIYHFPAGHQPLLSEHFYLRLRSSFFCASQSLPIVGLQNPVSPEPFVSRAKAPPAKRSEMGDEEENALLGELEILHCQLYENNNCLARATDSFRAAISTRCYPGFASFSCSLQTGQTGKKWPAAATNHPGLQLQQLPPYPLHHFLFRLPTNLVPGVSLLSYLGAGKGRRETLGTTLSSDAIFIS